MTTPERETAKLVTLASCPFGLFLFEDCLGFKSEYKTESLSHPGFWQVDAYVVESGEYFWGGESDPRKRDKLLVCPIDFDSAILAAKAEEREACAKVAAEVTFVFNYGGEPRVHPIPMRGHIAAAIRARGAPAAVKEEQGS